MKMRLNTKTLRGFTLIELIMAFIILTIGIIPLMFMIAQAAQKTAQPELLSVSTGLAENELERVTNLRFSQIVNEAPTAFGAPFANYTHEVTVSRVPPCPCPPGLADDPTMAQYKQVTVRIHHQTQGDVTLTTIVTNKVTLT